jgi:hypothetical protein
MPAAVLRSKLAEYVSVVGERAVAEMEQEVAPLNREVEGLFGQGLFSDAIELAQEAMDLASPTSLGPDHAGTLVAVSSPALIYESQERYGEETRSTELHELPKGKVKKPERPPVFC